MLKTLRLTTLAAFLALGIAACSDDVTEPEGTGFSPAEQQALINALTSSGALANSPAAGFAALVVGTLGEVGTISASQTAAMDRIVENGIQLAVSAALSSTYEGAVGVQIGYDIDGTQGWFIGVVGWNGLSTETNSVSQLVSIYHFDTDTGTPPATHSTTIGLDGLQQALPRSDADHHLATATYWDGIDTYWGTNGSVNFSGSSFSGSNDCSQLTFSCTYSTGSMSGTFEFESAILQGELTWTQVPVGFSNLPAVKLMISDS